MLLTAEILLTIAAWRKGWRGWSLLPMGIVLGVASVIGLAVGTAGGTQQDLIGPGLVLDAMAVVALITMTARSPKRA